MPRIINLFLLLMLFVLGVVLVVILVVLILSAAVLFVFLVPLISLCFGIYVVTKDEKQAEAEAAEMEGVLGMDSES